MKRWVLFLVTFTLISTLALAQAVVTPSGQATTPGVAVPMAPVSPPLITTPLMHLGNAQTIPSPGTAAITTTSPAPEPPSAVPIRPEIDYGQQVVYVGPTAGNASSNSPTTANAAATLNGRPLVDLGVHSDAAVAFDDGTNGRSLGEIARANRQQMQNANAKTFTNADVARVAGTGGVSGVATNPANADYPANNGAINTNGIATQMNVPPAGEQNAQPPAVAEPSAPNQKPSAAPHEMAQAQTPANPADQNAAETRGTEQRTLPKSASFLPLIAVLGLGATAAGFVVRRVRK